MWIRFAIGCIYLAARLYAITAKACKAMMVTLPKFDCICGALPRPVTTDSHHGYKHSLFWTIFLGNLTQLSMHDYFMTSHAGASKYSTEAITSKPSSKSSFKSFATSVWRASKVSTPSSPVAYRSAGYTVERNLERKGCPETARTAT